MFRTNAYGYTLQYNSQYNYNGGWEAGASPVYVGGANATLCAYYPYGAAPFTANSFVCTLSAQKWAADKDLCYATTGGDAVCNQTPFSMKRAYSRITLNIQRHATNYTGNCKITNVNLKNSAGNFFSNRTLNISNGTYGGNATSGGWDYALNADNIAAGATNTAYDVLVPPQPVNGGLTITLKADGKDRVVTIPPGEVHKQLACRRPAIRHLPVDDRYGHGGQRGLLGRLDRLFG